MINLQNVTFAIVWRAGIVASVVWAIGGALDGATLPELLTVPMIVGAWISAVVLIDRWVMRMSNKKNPAGGAWVARRSTSMKPGAAAERLLDRL